jgi:spore germination protein
MLGFKNYYEVNTSIIEDKFIDVPDLVRRQVVMRDYRKGYIYYVEGLSKLDLIQRDFIGPILQFEPHQIKDPDQYKSLPAGDLVIEENIDKVIREILTGSIVFVCEGIQFFAVARIRSFEKRSITEPEVEKNVRGAHEGFIESLCINMSILRRKVKDHNLKFKNYMVGETTNQHLIIAYVEGIVNKQLVRELDNKLKTLNFDGMLGIGYIEQFITDFKFSPFPQYQATERTDKAVAALLEGKILIMLDGTPVVLMVPVNFFAFFQTPDDYNTHWIVGSSIRSLRLLGGVIALLLPAIYIAIITYHYYMIPLNWLGPIAISRSKVPFIPVVEALIMELAFEMLREAAVRLPNYVSSSIGVVGGLIIGQAAVAAGIVSNIMLAIVGLTAIASFIIPTYDMGLALRLGRFAAMIMAGVFGLFGVLIFSSVLLAHLVSLESLGQPYFQPIIPLKLRDLKDSIIRGPLSSLRNRPVLTQPVDKKRGKQDE